MDGFLYDRDLRHEKVNADSIHKWARQLNFNETSYEIEFRNKYEVIKCFSIVCGTDNSTLSWKQPLKRKDCVN